MVPDHMKDKTKFCMFHDDYGHTLATCKNLYAQLRAMIRKGMLLKYLKKKFLLGSLNKPRETERVVIKTASEGVAKDPQTSGSGQNLKIITFIRKDDEEKERKYDRFAARREERNMRTNALRHHVFGISEEKNTRPKMSVPFGNTFFRGFWVFENPPSSKPVL